MISCFVRRLGVITLAVAAMCASAQAPHSASGSAPASNAPAVSAAVRANVSPVPVRKWVRAPRVHGRINAKELGLVINEDDPYSVEVGQFYAKVRQIPTSNILKVKLPLKPTLSPSEFADLRQRIDSFFGANVQGLALAWRQPSEVNCNAITGALALGYDAKLCNNTCAPTRPSPYFASASSHPYRDHGLRISMLLAASDVKTAKAMITRGVKSDGTLGLRGGMPVNVHYVTTSDAIRSRRSVLFPPPGVLPRVSVQIHLDETDGLKGNQNVLMYLTGAAQVPYLSTVKFVPGALGDSLTSFGGALGMVHDQTTVLDWVSAGVTATYGTTSEPCAHLQKFPDPQALFLFYGQGSTALEAYWKSVRWPQQGLFVGDPLAAPFSRALQ